MFIGKIRAVDCNKRERGARTAIFLLFSSSSSSVSLERDPVSRTLCSQSCASKMQTVSYETRSELIESNNRTVANVLKAVSSNCSVLKSACKAPSKITLSPIPVESVATKGKSSHPDSVHHVPDHLQIHSCDIHWPIAMRVSKLEKT